MKRLQVLFVLFLLAGCSDAPNETTASLESAEPLDIAVFTPFARLNERLADGLAFREQRIDHIEVSEPFRDDIDAEELTDLLEAQQKQVLRIARASWLLRPPLPPELEYTEQDIEAGRHLDGVKARLVNNCLLLDADAIRCWSNDNFDGCVARFGASLRIGLCMWGDTVEQTRFSGARALTQTLIELKGRVADGLAERVSKNWADETGQMLSRIDLSGVPGWSTDSEGETALQRVRAAFPDPSSP